MWILLSLFYSLAFAAVEQPNTPKAVVTTSNVEASEIADTLTFPARVVPKVNTTILSEIDGTVVKILAPLGQKVWARQKVLILRHTDPVYQYAPVTVLSPVSGVVSSVDVTEGTQVTKGEKLASVTDPRQIRLAIEVPALDLPSLAKGMVGEFRISGRTDDKDAIPVRIRGLSPFVDPATGTATCELEVDGAIRGATLIPGLLGQITYRVNRHSGIAIDADAIVYRGADTFVRILDHGKSRQIPVQLGRRVAAKIEILKGLSAGARLIQRASRFVSDGESVVEEGKSP